MTSLAISALLDHLWQSTLFAAGTGCLTLLLRKNSARVRCLLWLAASAKFLLPFALLSALGAHIPWPRGPIQGVEPALFSTVSLKIGQIAHLGAEGTTALPQIPHAADVGAIVLAGLGVLWAGGVIVVAAHWYARWRQIRRALLSSTPTDLAFVIPVRSSSSQLEPAVVGFLRPVLLLPVGLERRLSVAELHAVLAHERCHVMWRDNLAATAHMLVEALFWFHPLIWWLGARIVDERERACDEQVLAEGHRSETYAEGILKVCEHYLGSDLACVAGIGGADLRHRIDGIMTGRLVARLSTVRTLVIALAAGASFAVPVAMGFLTSPPAYAHASFAGSAPDFDHANIGEIAAVVTRATHKTIVIDRRVHARDISAHFPDQLTPEQFYRQFVDLLRSRHLIAIPAADAVWIVPNESGTRGATSQLYLGPPRAWELRDEVWLGFPDPATQPRRP